MPFVLGSRYRSGHGSAEWLPCVDSFAPETRMNTGFANANHALAREILTIAELNRIVAELLRCNIGLVEVVGEISNLTRAPSGHCYFTLKDTSAQLRAVMFRGRAQHLSFVPRNGDRVEARGLVNLYEPRGDVQLNVEAMRPAGQGDLYRRFVQLKEKLLAEGLFDTARKLALPAFPRTVGIITSPRAAALRDVLVTLRRRAPAVEVIVYPALVQGGEAPAALRAALHKAVQRAECEVLLLVRGGGSIEDLWAFNDEALARAIAACPIPVVSGVGHESDSTIADFVADERAPTPTGAAVRAVPDRAELRAQLAQTGVRLARARDRRLEAFEQRLDTAARLLRPPSAQWQMRAQHLHSLARRLGTAAASQLQHRTLKFASLRTRLQAPATAFAGQRLEHAGARLGQAAAAELRRCEERLAHAAAALELVSPQAVLERGYAIVRDADGAVVSSIGQTRPGAEIQVHVRDGRLDALVRTIRPDGA